MTFFFLQISELRQLEKRIDLYPSPTRCW